MTRPQNNIFADEITFARLQTNSESNQMYALAITNNVQDHGENWPYTFVGCAELTS